MHVYVCEHAVYNCPLRGKEPRLIFIQLNQGLHTLHSTSGIKRVCKQKKKEKEKRRQMLMIQTPLEERILIMNK